MNHQQLTKIIASSLAVIAGSLIALPSQATEVLMRTNLGDIRIDLFEDEAPITVQNFLEYVREGGYEQGIIHRSVRNFVIQGGRDKIVGEELVPIETRPSIQNEPGISNQRGTIAMAKRNGDPNSATSQWFFNMDDNSFLDSDNGGFTVFGEVSEDSLAVLDAINALPIVNAGQFFSELPLFDWSPGDSIGLDNFVVLSVEEFGDFQINPGLNDAWYNPATAGQGFFINVFPDAGSMFVAWFTYDVERPAPDVTATLGEPGHRWITAQGAFTGDRANLSATLTSGGIFDSASPAPVNEINYGTIEIVFTGCDAAEVRYDFPGQSLTGTVEIQRVVKDNVALCEALAEPAATR